jgi:threonine/homoserine/homoserine lactone efflux protein
MLLLFFKSILIGFAIAAPVGPIGILCIQRSLHDGFKVGLMTGLGAALADGTYGLIAGLGLSAVSSLLIGHQLWVRMFGGAFLVYLGMKLLLTKPRKKDDPVPFDHSPWHACGTTYLLTLANPITILAFVAIFSGLGLVDANQDYKYAIVLVSGITLGSALWWLLLSGGVAFILHKRMSPNFMRMINWVAGGILLTFGVIALVL